MSLMIKVVDMPKSGETMAYFFKEIIEIPTPHGRLIDDYKLLRALIKAFPNQSMNFYDTLERVIDEAPTIIEAEVVEE